MLEDWIVWIEPWVEDYGLYFITGGILLENAGFPMPGETFIIIGGIMAARDIFTLKSVFLASIIGAVLGGLFGFAVGIYGGRPLILRAFRFFHIPVRYLSREEKRFQRWGHWAVFFGRFPLLLRVLAGPLAGVMSMPFWKFFLFNAAGAGVWVAVMVGIAYKLGENLPLLEKIFKYLGRGALVIIVGLIVFLMVYHNRQKRREKAQLQGIQ